MNREKQELLSELASVGIISQEMAQLVRYEYLFKQLLDIIEGPMSPFVGELDIDSDIVHNYYSMLYSVIKEAGNVEIVK